MKLLVNGQIFQTGALERGMGSLAIELLRGVQRQDEGIDIVILLNKKLGMSEEHARRLKLLLDGFEFAHISLETPATGPESRAKEQLESYIQTQISQGEDVVYLEPAMFLFDYFALFPKNCRTMLIFHDLIPLVMWEHLKNVFPGHVYFARFPLIFEADIILTNSQNTKLELVRLLGLTEENIVVIGGAPEAIKLKKSEALKRVRDLGINKPYILLPTGGGHMNHKNNMRAAEALYLLRRDTDREFIVVATSRYEGHERRAMQGYLNNEDVFTGNISRLDMWALYCCAEVVLCPALAEGLGIPLLNAISKGVPVAASRIPVYTELSNGDSVFYDFDPYDVWEMRDALLRALARVGFAEKEMLHKALLERYTWDNSALQLISALQMPTTPRLATTKKLQVFMPDPLANVEEAYIAQSLLAVSARHGYEVYYYIDPSINPVHYDDRGADYVRYIAQTYDISTFSPSSIGSLPSLVFLPRDANFARLHLLSRVIEGAIVYVSGDVSHRVYYALAESGIIDPQTAEQEKKTQRLLSEKGMFSVPHPFVKARGILVEERAEKALKKLLKQLDIRCPVQVVPNNCNKNLHDYVHGEVLMNDTILSFVSEIAAND